MSSNIIRGVSHTHAQGIMKILIILLFILFSFSWSVKAEECSCKELEKRVHELERSLFWLNQELKRERLINDSWYHLEYPLMEKGVPGNAIILPTPSVLNNANERKPNE